ncbi:hypothetical protein [Alkaliphilus metalliredigens]|uniref:hypothetical protein n=1 Tax=Alkaliphilus metalliredigens TaxID=208226 RepID=UPI0012ECE394|nr:hypothetical protein [Alkaliphilus metalliredigens]
MSAMTTPMLNQSSKHLNIDQDIHVKALQPLKTTMLTNTDRETIEDIVFVWNSLVIKEEYYV